MNKKILIYLLPLIFLGCKKQSPEIIPEPTNPDPAKPLVSTRSTNSNGHSILTTYNYNAIGKIYQEISKDEITGQEMYEDFRHKDGVLYASDTFNDDRKLSRINYSYSENKLTKMRYYEYDQYLNTEFLFERNLEYKDGQIYKISTSDINGVTGEYTVFIFSGGNVTETKTYSANGTLINSCRYEYDQKINPYFGQYSKLQSAVGYSRANVIKSVQTDHRTNTTTTANYTYDYNKADQPTAMYAVTAQRKLITNFYY
ncbi:hypothetical protein ACXZ1K_07925 [Pedobacter sp. PWIIR3]